MARLPESGHMESGKGARMSKTVSILQAYRDNIKLAGSRGGELKKSYLAYALANITQGIAYAVFFPLLGCFFGGTFYLNEALGCFFALVLLSIISLVLQWYGLSFHPANISQIIHETRVKLGNKLKTMPLQTLSTYRTGELNNTLAQNVDDSVMMQGTIAGMLASSFILPLTVILCVFFIDIRMGFALLLAFPFLLPLYRFSRNQSREGKKASIAANKTLEADTLEYLQGLGVLRSVNKVGENSQRLLASINEVKRVQTRGLFIGSAVNALLSTLLEFTFLGVLALGSLWIVGGTFCLSSLLALLIILNRLNEPVSLFISLAGVIDLANEGLKNIKEILDQKDLPILGKKTLQHFDIRFEDVTFSYLNSDQKVLENINLYIQEKSLTAIVGKSGSGKTTLTRLMLRYDDPQNGVVKIGGVDVRELEQGELMRHISVVFQDIYLFDDTILNNIRMGNPQASDEKVKEAAKKAHCHEFIERFEQGYETRVGEIGGSLSGGERQRISIARAILKDAPIVLLDEPTSALDTESEVAVQKALDELIKSKTVIVIAHRLSTISHADNIVVVENRGIAQQGTHEALIVQDGRYKSMFAAQQRIKTWNIGND